MTPVYRTVGAMREIWPSRTGGGLRGLIAIRVTDLIDVGLPWISVDASFAAAFVMIAI